MKCRFCEHSLLCMAGEFRHHFPVLHLCPFCGKIDGEGFYSAVKISFECERRPLTKWMKSMWRRQYQKEQHPETNVSVKDPDAVFGSDAKLGISVCNTCYDAGRHLEAREVSIYDPGVCEAIPTPYPEPKRPLPKRPSGRRRDE